jgi:TolB-like protein
MMLLSVAVFGQYVSTETLAIPYFKNNAENSEYTWLSEALADMLTTDIAATKKIWVVNRLDLKKVLEEQKLSLSGMVSDASMVNLGNLSGASLILTGSFTIYGDQIRIDAKIFNIETGTSQGAASTIGSVQDIFVLEKKLAVQVLDALTIPLTDDDKINLFQIASGDFKAIENNYRGVIALDKNDKESAKQYFQKAVNKDPYYRNAQSNLDITTKAIDGGGLFTAALGELGQKDKQLVSLKNIMNRFQRTALEVKVVGAPEIITDAGDQTKVDIALNLSFTILDDSRGFMLTELKNISAGEKEWKVVDIKDYSKRKYTVKLYPESVAWLDENCRRMEIISLIQLQSSSEQILEIPIKSVFDAFGSSGYPRFNIKVYRYAIDRWYTRDPITSGGSPHNYKYILKDVPIEDVKKMTKVTIKDVTDE